MRLNWLPQMYIEHKNKEEKRNRYKRKIGKIHIYESGKRDREKKNYIS